MIEHKNKSEKEKGKRRWKANREAGLCGRCGSDLGSSQKSLCPKCAEENLKASRKFYENHKYKLAELHVERYKRRRAAGICVSCGKVPAAEGIVRCDVCQQKQRTALMRHYIKQVNEGKAADG